MIKIFFSLSKQRQNGKITANSKQGSSEFMKKWTDDEVFSINLDFHRLNSALPQQKETLLPDDSSSENAKHIQNDKNDTNKEHLQADKSVHLFEKSIIKTHAEA